MSNYKNNQADLPASFKPMDQAPTNGNWVILWYLRGPVIIPVAAHYAVIPAQDEQPERGMWFMWGGAPSFIPAPPDPQGWSAFMLAKEDRQRVVLAMGGVNAN